MFRKLLDMSIIGCNLHSAGQVHDLWSRYYGLWRIPSLRASYIDGRDLSAMTLKTTLSMFTFICFVQRRTVPSFSVYSARVYTFSKGKARCRPVLQTPPSNSMIVRVLLCMECTQSPHADLSLQRLASSDLTGLYLVTGYWLSLVKPPYYTPRRKKIVSALWHQWTVLLCGRHWTLNYPETVLWHTVELGY